MFIYSVHPVQGNPHARGDFTDEFRAHNYARNTYGFVTRHKVGIFYYIYVRLTEVFGK